MPPPIPTPVKPAESIWHTYARAVAIMLPAFLFLNFSAVFLFPRVEQIWIDTGLIASRARWLVNATQALLSNGVFVLIGVLLVFCLLECYWRPWARWRAPTTTVVVALFNLFVLTTLTLTSVSVCLAIPKALAMGKIKKTAPPETPPSPATLP